MDKMMAECQFCHKKKEKSKMIQTAYGLYCRQCWLDHYC